jgi:dipeptidyl aminopeptidase/acylaminoacyl peptidase
MSLDETAPRSSNRLVWIILGIIGGVLLLIVLSCAGAVYLIQNAVKQFLGDVNAATPGLELQDEDYAKARTQFQTTLLRSGPAPQPYQPVSPPPGVQSVEYPSGKLKLRAWTTAAPQGGAKQPAVIFLHGGFAFDADDWDMTKPYRDAGFAVMTPILRAENGQPGVFTMFYDEVDDVLAAAEWLAQQPHIDKDRLFVAGHSAGGTLTLLASMASPRFKAATSFSGSPDQVIFGRTNANYVVFNKANIREYQMRSPVAFAGSFKCPVRLYYGTAEIFFNAPSQRTANLAKEHGLDVEAVTVPGDHFSSVSAAMAQSIEFFKGR